MKQNLIPEIPDQWRRTSVHILEILKTHFKHILFHPTKYSWDKELIGTLNPDQYDSLLEDLKSVVCDQFVELRLVPDRLRYFSNEE